jgi:hypothetical protein
MAVIRRELTVERRVPMLTPSRGAYAARRVGGWNDREKRLMKKRECRRGAGVSKALRFTASVFALVFLAGCPAHHDETDLAAAYLAAVEDAAVAEPEEICRSLTAIAPYNEDLVWQGEGDERRVLMATWTGYTGYDELAGKRIRLDDLRRGAYEAARDIWVTPVPEVKAFCRRHPCVPPERRVLRLEQLLGLPSGSGKTRFVEFWVKPEDLFRPAPDPEVSDCEAELDFPVSGQFVTVDPAHIAWFQSLMEESYGEDGYPWTRLGYTYDWGNPFSDVGLSEFVIRPGAVVDVHSITLTAEYCRWGWE